MLYSKNSDGAENDQRNNVSGILVFDLILLVAFKCERYAIIMTLQKLIYFTHTTQIQSRSQVTAETCTARMESVKHRLNWHVTCQILRVGTHLTLGI